MDVSCSLDAILSSMCEEDTILRSTLAQVLQVIRMSLSKARHPYNTDITEAFNMRRKIFTARKRSLGQGNIFRSMCHSVQGGVFDATSCLAAWSHVPSRGGLCPWSHVPSGGSLSWGISVQGGLCQGVSAQEWSLCPGVESLPRSGVSVQEGSLCPGVESLSSGTSVWGRVSVQGVSVRGSLSRGGLCQRDPPTETSPYGKGRAVRILLECFLVVFFVI